MKPLHTLTDAERLELRALLEAVEGDPYRDYPAFSRSVGDLVGGGALPAFLPQVCAAIREERATGARAAHVLRNCPLDAHVPEIGNGDPLADKYARKHTFVAEAFHELFARLAGTPLLAYATRFNGDFFTDVIAHDRYAGRQTGFTDGELVFHNDRTAHRVRADFISLLGMRCPEQDLVYTGFVDGRALLAHLAPAEQAVLRQPYYTTPFDVVSRDGNGGLTASGPHPILEGSHSFRYLDTHTAVAGGCPGEAKDALIALKNALARAERIRHRVLTGDFLTFANQEGLHNRERVEVDDPRRARSRWLLKTYAFRDQAAADRHADHWVDGVRGRVGD
ncbi:TauD/TfdA family dioxygenase [Streptomyces fradiae]|uniref:TauD/TfdA family dioxygenase n=1 Tax=Streptomyces fradiae TaxID=1906 RepID=UPI002943CD50|nr:TauD/TfdA family dioxygenase [Streptomyces fradiae]WOI60981.1 TauD/TfdA family dioxygenase [Streptomyces fradiae]